MSAITPPTPPEPLTQHEQNIVLIKSRPPEPTWAFYLIAMFTALGGWIMGWIYLAKQGKDNKVFGLRAFLLGFVVPLAVVAIIVAIQIHQKNIQPITPQQPGKLLP